jgi:secreted trypsin-like serine protease
MAHHRCIRVKNAFFYCSNYRFVACGNVYTTHNIHARIVGGIEASQGSWPSIAFVQWDYKGVFLLPTGVKVMVTVVDYCGGTLISTRKILTAGK